MIFFLLFYSILFLFYGCISLTVFGIFEVACCLSCVPSRTVVAPQVQPSCLCSSLVGGCPSL